MHFIKEYSSVCKVSQNIDKVLLNKQNVYISNTNCLKCEYDKQNKHTQNCVFVYLCICNVGGHLSLAELGAGGRLPSQSTIAAAIGSDRSQQ